MSRLARHFLDRFFHAFGRTFRDILGGLGRVLRHVLCFFRRTLLRSSNTERNCRADDDCKKNFHGTSESRVDVGAVHLNRPAGDWGQSPLPKTISPPITVILFCALRISGSGIFMMSCERTVKSASLPRSIEPLPSSSNAA